MVKKSLVGAMALIAGLSFGIDANAACRTYNMFEHLNINQRAIQRDLDGIVYVKFNTDLNTLDNVIREPCDYRYEITPGFVVGVYHTLNDAKVNLDRITDYVVGLSTTNGRPVETYEVFHRLGVTHYNPRTLPTLPFMEPMTPEQRFDLESQKECQKSFRLLMEKLPGIIQNMEGDSRIVINGDCDGNSVTID